MQLSFAVEKCNKITYVSTWKFNSTRTTVILSLSLSPPHTPFSARLQHLLVRSTFRFNLNKFQLDFPTICSHFVAHFFLSLSLARFFSTFGNIYGQKVPFARLVACWSCYWCWCLLFFPFSSIFRCCIFIVRSVECFPCSSACPAAIRVRTVHWRARACRDSRWPLLHLYQGGRRGRGSCSVGGLAAWGQARKVVAV